MSIDAVASFYPTLDNAPFLEDFDNMADCFCVIHAHRSSRTADGPTGLAMRRAGNEKQLVFLSNLYARLDGVTQDRDQPRKENNDSCA